MPRLSLSLWLSLAACSAPAAPAERAKSPAVAPSPGRVSDAAPAAAASPAFAVSPAPAAAPHGPASAPPRGCALAEDLPLRDAAAQAWAVGQAAEPEFLVLREDRRTLEWWRGPWRALVLCATQHVAVPVARLSALRLGAGSQALVFVDDRGALVSLRYQDGRFGAAQELAQGADRRFAPALAMAGRELLVAFTRSVDLAMHTFVLRAGAAQPARDVTPAGHGAAAPTFIRGLAAPSLVAIDARGGVSPLLEVSFDAAGAPQPALVRTPVSQPYAPPLLSAVAVPDGEVEVAYTAVGKLAASAVGRVPLRRALEPSALHPSRGYGELSMAAALGTRAVVYALEVPRSAAQDAGRTIEIKWLDARGEGQTLVLPGASGSARLPSLAAGRRGEFVLAYTHEHAVRAALLWCDD